MVTNTPDPPREESAVSAENADVAIIGTDSEDEAETGYEGYSMLPSDAIDDESSEDDDEVDNTTDELASGVESLEQPNFERATAEEITAVWNAPADEPKEPMNQELTEEVLKAMKGFTLPVSAIPPWASEVGEDVWKNHLLDKIRNNK